MGVIKSQLIQTMWNLKKKGERRQRISLQFEDIREYDEKCGYYRFPEEQIQINPTEEIKNSIEAAFKLVKTHSEDYNFENVKIRSNQIEMDVSYKGLAFLILNSSPLHIKNISIQGRK